jgi:hypothetical protein
MSKPAVKERFLNIRVTESMYEELKRYAERELMTVSSAARRAMLLEIRRQMLTERKSIKAVRDEQEQQLLAQISQENRRLGGFEETSPSTLDQLPI